MAVWLVVGLGNPGDEYAATRHNVGQMVLDVLAARHGGVFKSGRGLLGSRPQAAVCDVRLGTAVGGAPGERVVLAKPTTYMNVSGGPVAGLLKSVGTTVDHLLVVHDELDIDAGVLRLKLGGGEGGHNGLRDISRAVGTKDYHRLRVGIGRPPGRMDAADYVLRPFGAAERKDLPFTLDAAADAVEAVVRDGFVAAQQALHGSQ